MATSKKNIGIVALVKTTDPSCQQHLQKLFRRGENASEQVERSVRDIIARVKQRGDRAVCDYTKTFDHVHMTPQKLAVTPDARETALTQLSRAERVALQTAA